MKRRERISWSNVAGGNVSGGGEGGERLAYS